jgi:hypothetical protein
VGDRDVAEKAAAASFCFGAEGCFLAEGVVSRLGTESQKIDLSRFSSVGLLIGCIKKPRIEPRP